MSEAIVYIVVLAGPWAAELDGHAPTLGTYATQEAAEKAALASPFWDGDVKDVVRDTLPDGDVYFARIDQPADGNAVMVVKSYVMSGGAA